MTNAELTSSHRETFFVIKTILATKIRIPKTCKQSMYLLGIQIQNLKRLSKYVLRGTQHGGVGCSGV